MEGSNTTLVTDFILLGLTDDPLLQLPLFVLFLLAYCISMVGNAGIILLTKISPRLHTPMYFLLRNLSFVDLCYPACATPNMLANLLSDRNAISFLGCALQMFLFLGFGSAETLLLAVMAYDRYAAICKPLLYHTILTERNYKSLTAGSYLIGLLNAMVLTCLTFTLHFCGSNINHFFCDGPTLFTISCSNTFLNEVLSATVGGIVLVGSLLVIVITYMHIVAALFRIHSTKGRHRAFSTCSSHFLVVTLYYGTIMFTYLRPKSSYSLEHDKVVAVFYSVIIPLLNPLIYSLRNQEVKLALREVMTRSCLHV
ncbi:olfactory receptor 5F1-like [Lissotriton helveticus]